MITLRAATVTDLDFLVEADIRTDLEDEGHQDAYPPTWSEGEWVAHRSKIAAFIGDEDKGAIVAEDEALGLLVGMILYRFRNRLTESLEALSDNSIFHELDERLFPSDGRFCEIFQLWVAPAYRRQGVATRLKRALETEARQRGVGLVYTHTREGNEHVIRLNRKLGYAQVRRGPIWDETARISLIKRLRP